MRQIHLTAKFHIQEGETEKFKSIAEQCVAVVQEKEKGKTCSQYDWYFNTDGSKCHVLESYADSAALMIHMGNVGELLGQLLQISTLTGDIYGNLSEEVQNSLQGLDVKSYSYFLGI
ncbi:MAG: hypothetical protein HN778_14175 [Prolixibacteraceae bacterium]|jgi:quinol monooxygenase YgiN|nr:hypothetical protein [Prolixibacteraceae bacterium]MBT6005647.1 hypothetical protein [Prolixibacteraceae bacterium]MBT6767269.1 hypothetical protein [Prolixibacteraceae bacterium]MBT6999161.1 hypothetical protein [Prolixibacteraceae bacterium]MBT7395974.1 hypothetical protein [Prolixibacteraceae bacterium]